MLKEIVSEISRVPEKMKNFYQLVNFYFFERSRVFYYNFFKLSLNSLRRPAQKLCSGNNNKNFSMDKKKILKLKSNLLIVSLHPGNINMYVKNWKDYMTEYI